MKNWGGVWQWNIPHLASSELSWQSLSPSQMYAGFVQIPVPHWNWPGLHLNSAVERHMHKCAFITHLLVMLQGENVSPTIHITHGSRQARQIGRHSRPRCHTSTRTGYTCRSCRQLMRDVEEHISNEKWYVSLWSLRSWSGSSIMRSPGWRCSWTCTVSHQRPGRSSWDRHIYNLRPERADTSYCSRRCLSGTGDLWLQRETRERYITPKTPTISRQITSRHKTRSSKLGSISEECLWQWCV